MKSILAIIGMIATLGILSSGCTQTEQGAVGGALAGGALGGIIGNQSGSAGEGALIGAAGGAVLGGIIGHSQEQKSAQSSGNVQLCAEGHEVDVTGYGPGALVRCPIDNSTFTVQ